MSALAKEALALEADLGISPRSRSKVSPAKRKGKSADYRRRLFEYYKIGHPKSASGHVAPQFERQYEAILGALVGMGCGPSDNAMHRSGTHLVDQLKV